MLTVFTCMLRRKTALVFLLNRWLCHCQSEEEHPPQWWLACFCKLQFVHLVHRETWRPVLSNLQIHGKNLVQTSGSDFSSACQLSQCGRCDRRAWIQDCKMFGWCFSRQSCFQVSRTQNCWSPKGIQECQWHCKSKEMKWNVAIYE